MANLHGRDAENDEKNESRGSRIILLRCSKNRLAGMFSLYLAWNKKIHSQWAIGFKARPSKGTAIENSSLLQPAYFKSPDSVSAVVFEIFRILFQSYPRLLSVKIRYVFRRKSSYNLAEIIVISYNIKIFWGRMLIFDFYWRKDIKSKYQKWFQEKPLKKSTKRKFKFASYISVKEVVKLNDKISILKKMKPSPP